MFFGLIALSVASSRSGVVGIWAPVAMTVGWLAPFVSGTGLVPAVAGALLSGAVLPPISVKLARMSDQAWAERPAARSRTSRAKAPKIAVESAA